MSEQEPRETWQLDTAHIGRNVLFFDSLDSTNTTAAALAPHHPDGLAIIADFQTSGRGQYGREWQAQPGTSLLLSVAIKPPSALCRPVILTAMTAVAVSDAIFTLTGLQSSIKWPNDLLINGKKVCGILIENTTSTVIGIGLNLNQTETDFTEAALPDATSLAVAAGTQIDTQHAAKTVLTQLDTEYTRLRTGETLAVEVDWKGQIGLLSRQVEVELTDGSTLTGRLREMSFAGLELDTGAFTPRVIVPELVRHISPVGKTV